MKKTLIRLFAAAGIGLATIGAVSPAVAQDRFYYRHERHERNEVGRLARMEQRLADLRSLYRTERANGDYDAAAATRAKIVRLRERINEMRSHDWDVNRR